MIGILLTILKIIGIILLVILLLILLIAAVVLFVPVRYDARASYIEKIPDACFRVHWLLHMVSVKGKYNKSGLEFEVKLFGRRLFPGKDAAESKASAEEEFDYHEDESSDYHEIIEKKDCADADGSDKDKVLNRKTEPEISEQPAETEIPADTVSQRDAAQLRNVQSSTLNKEKSSEEKTNRDKKSRKTKKAKNDESDNKSSVKTEGQSVTQKIEHWKGILLSDEMKAAFSKVTGRLIKIIRHILPGKIRGFVRFGTGNPASTGQWLARLAMLYPMLNGNLGIEPDFEQKIIEGEAELSGRIRLGYLVYCALIVIADKNVRKQIKLVRQK